MKSELLDENEDLKAEKDKLNLILDYQGKNKQETINMKCDKKDLVVKLIKYLKVLKNLSKED